MRLIDTKTHLLLEPWKAAGKEYAILSHTWGDQEVIFQEWEQLYPSGAIKGQCPHVRHQGIDKKAGYFKVMQACEQARTDNIDYLWCDTVCINKESSAELSEAINSMFKWYRDAKVCYVYLADVTFPGTMTCDGVRHLQSTVPGWFPRAVKHEKDADVREIESRFMASRWWSRGWTLQELLAPMHVAFFTQDWRLLGHKIGISGWISTFSRIHKEALQDHTAIRNFSIAQRMSWVADRQTTVVEDMAYCLLGLFGINMPMLYGQGESAFQKLQQEIIRASDDQSIFAWTPELNATPSIGAFATSPSCFKNCGSIVREPGSLQQPFSLTNVGFRMQVPIIKSALEVQHYLGLGCYMELHTKPRSRGQSTGNRRRIQVWIPIRKRGDRGLYERLHTPISLVFFQNSYPTSGRILENHEIFLLQSPTGASFSQTAKAESVNVSGTGIILAVGFGNMSIVSQAYKESWNPRSFHVTPLGSRRPCHSSHEIIVSGRYCIVLSVAWNENGQPSMNRHTTLRESEPQILSRLLGQLNQICHTRQHLSDVDLIHREIRAAHDQQSGPGQDPEAPMILVEDETLYDMDHSPYIMVDIIFKEKRIPDVERKQIHYDIAFS